MKSTLCVVVGAALSASVQAQSVLEERFPELAQLYNAFYVTQAQALDAVAAINADPALADERMELIEHMEMMAEMDMHSMHGGGMDMDMGMDMGGPFGEAEMQARMALGQTVRGDYEGPEAEAAIMSIEAVPNHARMVLRWGRIFEDKLWNIWADDMLSLDEKRAATATAIEEYETGDPRHAVSVIPKNAELYLSTDYADALAMGYPRISGLLWANQWLQLASLEALILGEVDSQFAGRVPVTLERYRNKVGSDSGMTMFPAPTEMPSAPAIAPQLYTQAPEAARIIDNLNMLETAIADIVAYPNLDEETRTEAIMTTISYFTSDEEQNTDEMNYLLSALRGGIYNQGGPAIGELMGSERNRSREAMDMIHTMIMSSPQ
ncbi:MAG: hypothetical protein MRY76_02085 [Pseudomonadales bacterium]|nr:hypothetical protein [Pseudomonadales bacterium]